MKEKLDKLFEELSLKTEQGNLPESLFTIANEALELIEHLLMLTPFDYDLFDLRIQLNTNWIFNNVSKIIEDATYVANEPAFKENRLKGYEWLIWVYDEVLAMPNKVNDLLLEQIELLPAFYKEHYKKDEIEGFLLDRLAQVEIKQNRKNEAFDFWKKSFYKYPYIHDRNAFAGLLALELEQYDDAMKMLYLYFIWNEDLGSEYEVEIVEKLEQLIKQKKLDRNPQLIGLHFYIRRNMADNMQPAAFKKYADEMLPSLLSYYEKYPTDGCLNVALARTYEKLGNIQKSYEYRLFLAQSKDSTIFGSLLSLSNCAEKLKKNFFEIPFSISQHSANDMYYGMTEMYNKWNDTKDLRYLSLAIKLGEQCYKLYTDYFENGIGNNYSNQPHIFAMACNNYALAIRYLNYDDANNSSNPEACAKAANIHWKGYQYSSFWENIHAARWDAHVAGLYEDCIKYATILQNDFTDSIDNLEIQQNYWYIIECNIQLDNIEAVQTNYLQSKTLFEEHTEGDYDATKKFIFNAQETLIYLSKKEEANDFYEAELNWFLSQTIFEEYEPVEYALISYLYAESLNKLDKKQEALCHYEKCITLLNQPDLSKFYRRKFEAAKLEFAKLGGDISEYPMQLENLFFDTEITYQNNYSLHPKYNDENSERLMEIVETYRNYEEYVSVWISKEKNIFITIGKDRTGKNEGEYTTYLAITCVNPNDSEENTKYEFQVIEKLITEGGFFSKKKNFFIKEFNAIQSSNYEEQKYYEINDKNFEPQTEAQKKAHEQGQYWWNEICNRFYN